MKEESWIKQYWRPAIAWQYFAVCLCDFIVFPLIAFEYGVTDKLMIGLGRSKGTGAPYKSLIDGFAKYRILHQQKKGCPISLSAMGLITYSYMKASSDISEVSNFPLWQHRLAYTAQLVVARKFGNRLSLALMPTMLHRNYVA